MVRTRQPRIERAKAVVEGEMDLIGTERDAFERFLGRLREVGTTGPDTAPETGGPTGLATTTTAVSGRLDAVRSAYRETVMAVPHYEEEYGDTLRESLAAEFGDSLAGHLTDGEVLAPAVYDALLGASEAARDNRTEFLRHLRREHDSLEGIADELNDIEVRVAGLGERIGAASTSADLATVDGKLERLERRCTDLANRRQETIHGRSTRGLSGIEERSLLRYLYADMETITPALADVAACLDTVRRQRERCLR